MAKGGGIPKPDWVKIPLPQESSWWEKTDASEDLFPVGIMQTSTIQKAAELRGLGPHSDTVIVPILGHPPVNKNGSPLYENECFWMKDLGWRVRGSGVSNSEPCLTGPHPWPNPGESVEPEEWDE